MDAPMAFLEKALQQPARLLLKDGRRLAGRLSGYDEHLNLVLDDTEETGSEVERRLGRVVVRGSQIVSVTSGVPPGTVG